MTHVSSPHRLQYPKQVSIGNQSQVNPTPITQPEVYVINMTMCLLWATKLFGSHRKSFTPMFQAFHLKGLTVPFLLRPTHLIYISFYALNRESFIGRRPKYELTTHLSTMMMGDHTHAHTPNIMRCPCAYAMLMPRHVLMLHV